MSQLVKTKRQANFKDFKRFGAFKGFVEQKNVVFNSFMCKLGLFWHEWANLHTNWSNKLILFYFNESYWWLNLLRGLPVYTTRLHH
jgi:hypothetical protein